ncbi:hypothetical protein DAEQUDRAFT_770688 [Daedalea quercina L-15889]|uniref:Uncharacterized protein n=1 Tax=Daedalea quercina L-15889 TaxID=1314783 RepID=A0A165KNL1_9APHY|nr:hypothetical protein DAEQUDRAFT_770688 [Daedalea quercina L-15889]
MLLLQPGMDIINVLIKPVKLISEAMESLLPVLVETIKEVLLVKNHLEVNGGGSYILGKYPLSFSIRLLLEVRERTMLRETLSKRSGCRGGGGNGANRERMRL